MACVARNAEQLTQPLNERKIRTVSKETKKDLFSFIQSCLNFCSVKRSELYFAHLSGFRLADMEHVTTSWVSSPQLPVSLLSSYSLAERDNVSVTTPSVFVCVCFVSFTGGNKIPWTDCGTNGPGQSSCTGVRFQPLKWWCHCPHVTGLSFTVRSIIHSI